VADTITQVYGGRATITFHELKHYYTVTVPGVCENLYQPSVTSAIGKLDKSAGLVPWAVECMTNRAKELINLGPTNPDRDSLHTILDAARETWRRVKQESADIGSFVHGWLEQELKGRSGVGVRPSFPVNSAPGLTPEMIEKANLSIAAGRRFFDEHNIEIVQAEAPRWSPTFGYVGTGDLIARVDGDLAALDYKTGKRLYPTVFLQLAAYQKAYEEEFTDQQIVKRIGVNVGRDGHLETAVRDNSTLERDFECFLALLTAWRWDRENQGKWSKSAPAVIGNLDVAIERSQKTVVED